MNFAAFFPDSFDNANSRYTGMRENKRKKYVIKTSSVTLSILTESKLNSCFIFNS